MRSHLVLTFLAALFLLSQASLEAKAKILDRFKSMNETNLVQPWKSGSPVSPAAQWVKTKKEQRVTRFGCPFAALKEWRVCWDKKIQADLSEEDQILIQLRSPNPTAIGQIIIYFKSGNGWYRLNPFGVSKSWRDAVLLKDNAGIEGSPTGWHAVDGIRLSIEPAEKRDTYVELKLISARKGWPGRHIGTIGQYTNFEQARDKIKKAAKATTAEKDVNARLIQANKLKEEIKAAADKGEKSIQKKIIKARQLMSEAYALIQDPKTNEFRGFWAHQGDGIRSLGGKRVARWKDAIPMIAGYGFNAIFPNMLWTGVAYYPSKIVPNHPGVKEEGDYMQEIIDAAKPVNVEVHAWKVMWQFAEGWLAQPGVSEPFRKAGRLQKDSSGKEVAWLCPSDPRNQQIELDATMEMAEYDIQGIHLDYIRYQGDNVCYCDGCRTRFEKQSGKPVEDWPKTVMKDGSRGEEYAQWKQDQITSFVRKLKKALKKKNPGLKLSAAVFSQPEQAKMFNFQDWAFWAQQGLLDFVCTMTYTEDLAQFQNAVRVQTRALQGKTPLYVGIYATQGYLPLALDVMVDEILATRKLGAQGFVLFELRDFLQDTSLPFLRAGLTRQDEYKLFFREIPKDQRPAKVKKGKKLEVKGNALLLDDFEDGDLINALNTAWTVEADSNNLGTVLNPMPFTLTESGAQGSKYFARIWGHYGKSQAPWPYVLLRATFDPVSSVVDLNEFKAIEFRAKGDGKLYEVHLIKDVVKDYSHFRQAFSAPQEWTKVVLPLDKFMQPGWGKPEERTFSDVMAIHFGPSGSMSDEDFDLSVDNVRLVK